MSPQALISGTSAKPRQIVLTACCTKTTVSSAPVDWPPPHRQAAHFTAHVLKQIQALPDGSTIRLHDML